MDYSTKNGLFNICGLWRNTENGQKDEIDYGIYFFRVPKTIALFALFYHHFGIFFMKHKGKVSGQIDPQSTDHDLGVGCS